MVFMLVRPLRCKRNVKVIQIPVERAVSVLVQLRAWCAFKVQCGSLQRLQVHGPESAPMGLLYQEADTATLMSGLMRNSKQHVVENINDLPKHVGGDVKTSYR